MHGEFDIWFNNFINIDSLKKKELIKEFKVAENLWNADLKSHIFDILSFDEKSKFLESKNINFEKMLKEIKSSKVNIIKSDDSNFPDELKNLQDIPYLIYYKGKKLEASDTYVSIIGSRNCTKYGKKVAYELSYELAKEGINVVSGLSMGIDTYAHIGAIKAEGKTLAVTASGLNVIYPKSNEALITSITNKGTLISEYYLSQKPVPDNFPKRNRIIAALSKVIVVVEAEDRCDALSTVTYGLEMGKEVCAVPGNIYVEQSKGCNKLIQDGAFPITKAKDILNLL